MQKAVKRSYALCPKCNAENRETSQFCLHCGALLKISPPASPPPELRKDSSLHAGFGRRSLAFLVDLIVPGFFSVILALFFTLVLFGPSHLLSDSFESIKTDVLSQGLIPIYLIPLIFFLTGWLYHTLLESSGVMATPGKQVAEIFVTDRNNTRITFGKASIRFFVKFVPPVIVLILFLFDFPALFKILLLLLCFSLFLPLGPENLSIIDRTAGTQVLMKKEPEAKGQKLSLSLLGTIEEVIPALSKPVPEEEIKITDEPFLEREAPPDDILKKLRKSEGKDFMTYAKLGKNDWLCVCGTFLKAGYTKCPLCKREKYYVLNH